MPLLTALLKALLTRALGRFVGPPRVSLPEKARNASLAPSRSAVRAEVPSAEFGRAVAPRPLGPSAATSPRSASLPRSLTAPLRPMSAASATSSAVALSRLRRNSRTVRSCSDRPASGSSAWNHLEPHQFQVLCRRGCCGGSARWWRHAPASTRSVLQPRRGCPGCA